MPFWKTCLIRAGAIIGGSILLLIITAILLQDNPFYLFQEMFSYFMFSDTWDFFHKIAMLLLFAVAVTPGFKMKFWNIGAEGQFIMGGLACALCMYYGERLGWNGTLVIFMSLFGALFAGALWAAIPAVFKAFWNTNETLFTLMMNYVAILSARAFTEYVKGGTSTNPLSNLTVGTLPKLPIPQLANILIVILITVAIFVYLKYSKHGYEISIVGDSENTAKYVGINVKKAIIRTLVLSGALAGVAAFLLVNGNPRISSFSDGLEGGMGFTAIIVSWLAKFNPLYMILTSSFVVFLQESSKYAVNMLGLMDSSFADITVAIYIICLISCEFFIAYQIKMHRKPKFLEHFSLKKKKAAQSAATVTDAENAAEIVDNPKNDDTSTAVEEKTEEEK